jgi:hypothetical protein
MINIENFDQIKKNCAHFWNKEYIGRPYICITAPKNNASIDINFSYSEQMINARNGEFLVMPKRYLEAAKNTFFGGEALPYYKCGFGPDQYASFYGAEIIAKKGEYTTWVHPIAESIYDLDCKLNPENKYLSLLEKSIKATAEFADGRFLIPTLDFHSNLDTLSALLGPEQLCFELMDNPDIVIEKVNQITDDYPYIYDRLYYAADMDKLGSISWLPVYSEGKTAVVECDFSCMIGPDLARKVLYPSLEREIKYLTHSIYHLDGKNALSHVDFLLSVKELDCIQWVPGDGDNRSPYWMELLTKIQKAGKSVWLYDWTMEEILNSTLDPSLTMYNLWLDSEDEAKRFLEKIEKKYK